MAQDNLIWKKLVVRVYARTANFDHYRGTAFFINDRYLLTARHVINPYLKNFEQDVNQIILRNGPTDGDLFLESAPIPHPNEAIDVALLKLRMPIGESINFLPWKEDNNLVGKTVNIAGFDDASQPSSPTPLTGLKINNQFYSVELQGKGLHGKSGGPVIFDNKLVGILYAQTDAPDSRKDQNKTYIYPYCTFKDFLVENGVDLPSQKATGTQSEIVTKNLIDFTALNSDERAALINREEQWDKHIKSRINTEKDRKTFAFVVAGVDEEWPEALRYRLLLHHNVKKPIEIHELDHQEGDAGRWETDFLSILLNNFVNVRPSDIEEFDAAESKALLQNELAESPTPLIFYCFLKSRPSKNFPFLQFIISYWESLELTGDGHRHFLFIVFGLEKRSCGWCSFIKRGEKKVEIWRKTLVEQLTEHQTPKIVTPKLKSPKLEDVLHWSRTYLEGKEQTQFDKAIEQIKRKQIPHRTLKDIYNQIN